MQTHVACTLHHGSLTLAACALCLDRELSLKDVKVDVLGADGSTVLSSSGAYPKELLKSPQIPAQQSIQVRAAWVMALCLCCAVHHACVSVGAPAARSLTAMTSNQRLNTHSSDHTHCNHHHPHTGGCHSAGR